MSYTPSLDNATLNQPSISSNSKHPYDPQAVCFLISHKPTHPIPALSLRRNQASSYLAHCQSATSLRAGLERRQAPKAAQSPPCVLTKLHSDPRKDPVVFVYHLFPSSLTQPCGCWKPLRSLRTGLPEKLGYGQGLPHPPWHLLGLLSQPLSFCFPFFSARSANVRVMTQGCYRARTVYRIKNKSQEQVG